MEIPTSYIPMINIALVVILAVSVIVGVIKGFVWELVNVLGLAFAVLIAWISAPGIAKVVRLYPESITPFADSAVGAVLYEKLNYYLWFVIILVACLVILAIIKPIFNALAEIPFLKQLNQFLGGLVGGVRGVALIVVVLAIMNMAIIKNGKDIIYQSGLKYAQWGVNKFTSVMSEAFAENIAIQKLLNDPLSLKKEDVQSVIDWLEKSKLSDDQIRDFLENYGIDANEINELLGN